MKKKIVKGKGRRKENLKIYTYVYIANTDKNCDLLHDKPVLSSVRTPHDK
jgi:hypothetical protein